MVKYTNESIRTMLLGLLFILVGMSVLFSFSDSFSSINSLVVAWAGSIPVHGSTEYNALIASTMQNGTWIALFNSLFVGGVSG